MRNGRYPNISFQKNRGRKKDTQSGAPAPFARINADAHTGLTEEQIRVRREAGAVNEAPKGVTPSLSSIVRRNVFTLFNTINLALAVLIVLVGHSRNAIFFFVAVCNTFMGIVQEIRAKRTLDKLAILSEGPVKAVRSGRTVQLSQRDIVLDDILLLSSGEQIYADATVLVSNGLEVNESLLTGEPDNVAKPLGSQLLSGSYVAAGGAYARVTAVGASSYANALAVEAKSVKRQQTPMMTAINRIIRVLSFIIIPLGALLFLTRWRDGVPNAILGAAAAMIGMIPEGLVLLTGVALTIGSLRLARASALVQTLPGIETLARTDIICLDKTGTITDGTLTLFDIIPVSGVREIKTETKGEIAAKAEIAADTVTDTAAVIEARSEAAEALREMLCALSEDNPVSVAVLTAIGHSGEWPVDARAPFSSERKWSGVSFTRKGSYILGAPDVLISGAASGVIVSDESPGVPRAVIESHTGEGRRVLCLAHSENPLSGVKLPDDLAVIAVVVLTDSLRPEAAATFKFFADEGVGLKVISGDDPLTVSSIAEKAGIEGSSRYIDMSGVGDPETGPGETPAHQSYMEIASQYTVFGRTSPRQKKALVRALKQSGHTVCMTGDGVNDVLAMKEADCSIAMRTGSGAARSAGDFVLMSSDFSAMKQILYEGRRVINNIETVSALYLIKTIYSTILSLVYLFMPAPYPFEPVQVTPINVFTVGVPSFFLTLRKNFEKPKGRFAANILAYSLPAAIVIVTNILIIHIFGLFMELLPEERGLMRIIATGAAGFYTLFMLSRPYGRWLMLFIAYVAVFSACLALFMPFFNLNALELRDILLLIPLLFCIPAFYILIRRLAARIFSRLSFSVFHKKAN